MWAVLQYVPLRHVWLRAGLLQEEVPWVLLALVLLLEGIKPVLQGGCWGQVMLAMMYPCGLQGITGRGDRNNSRGRL
jgi:hypothetical protein